MNNFVTPAGLPSNRIDRSTVDEYTQLVADSESVFLISMGASKPATTLRGFRHIIDSTQLMSLGKVSDLTWPTFSASAFAFDPSVLAL